MITEEQYKLMSKTYQSPQDQSGYLFYDSRGQKYRVDKGEDGAYNFFQIGDNGERPITNDAEIQTISNIAVTGAAEPSVDKLMTEEAIKAQRNRKVAYLGTSAGLEIAGLVLANVRDKNDPYLQELQERVDEDRSEEVDQQVAELGQQQLQKAGAAQRDLLTTFQDIEASKGGMTSARAAQQSKQAVSEAAMAQYAEIPGIQAGFRQQLEAAIEAEKEDARQALALSRKAKTQRYLDTKNELQKGLMLMGGFSPAGQQSTMSALMAQGLTAEQAAMVMQMRSKPGGFYG